MSNAPARLMPAPSRGLAARLFPQRTAVKDLTPAAPQPSRRTEPERARDDAFLQRLREAGL